MAFCTLSSPDVGRLSVSSGLSVVASRVRCKCVRAEALGSRYSEPPGPPVPSRWQATLARLGRHARFGWHDGACEESFESDLGVLAIAMLGLVLRSADRDDAADKSAAKVLGARGPFGNLRARRCGLGSIRVLPGERVHALAPRPRLSDHRRQRPPRPSTRWPRGEPVDLTNHSGDGQRWADPMAVTGQFS